MEKGNMLLLAGISKAKKHCGREVVKRDNYRMPSSYSSLTDTNVSMQERKIEEKLTAPSIPICDRVSSLQGQLLGVMAENNLPYTVAPVITDLAKAMTSDKKALSSSQWLALLLHIK